MTSKYTDYDEENDLVRRIATLERRIQDLERSPRANATSVDKGTLTVKDGTFRVVTSDDVTVLYVGPMLFGSETSQGWIMRRANGNAVFDIGGPNNSDQFWSLRDDSGNQIIGDDSASNQGLARPYIALPFQDSSSNVNFTNTTTSGSYTALQTCRYIKQHPKVYVYVLVRASDGATSGEVRLGIGGTPTQIGANIAVGLGGFFGASLSGEVPGSHLSEIELEVQARRTAGAGSIGVRVLGAYGRQS